MSEKQLFEGVVYRYVNHTEGDENGWCYVGNTLDETTRRHSWNNHGNKNYGGTKINEAREKYGPEGFDYEVLERLSGEDRDVLQKQLDEKEAEYISKFDSTNKGYNTSAGGTGNKGVNFSATHRANIGTASKGRTHSPATRQKISQKQKGRHVSPETKAKISAGNKGKKRSLAQNAAQSARMKGKIPAAAVAGSKAWVANNGGSYWSNHTISDEARANMKAAQLQRATPVKAILEDGSVQVYESMSAASEALGVMVGSIAYSLKHGNATKKLKIRFENV